MSKSSKHIALLSGLSIIALGLSISLPIGLSGCSSTTSNNANQSTKPEDKPNVDNNKPQIDNKPDQKPEEQPSIPNAPTNPELPDDSVPPESDNQPELHPEESDPQIPDPVPNPEPLPPNHEESQPTPEPEIPVVPETKPESNLSVKLNAQTAYIGEDCCLEAIVENAKVNDCFFAWYYNTNGNWIRVDRQSESKLLIPKNFITEGIQNVKFRVNVTQKSTGSVVESKPINLVIKEKLTAELTVDPFNWINSQPTIRANIKNANGVENIKYVWEYKLDSEENWNVINDCNSDVLNFANHPIKSDVNNYSFRLKVLDESDARNHGISNSVKLNVKIPSIDTNIETQIYEDNNITLGKDWRLVNEAWMNNDYTDRSNLDYEWYWRPKHTTGFFDTYSQKSNPLDGWTQIVRSNSVYNKASLVIPATYIGTEIIDFEFMSIAYDKNNPWNLNYSVLDNIRIPYQTNIDISNVDWSPLVNSLTKDYLSKHVNSESLCDAEMVNSISKITGIYKENIQSVKVNNCINNQEISPYVELDLEIALVKNNSFSNGTLVANIKFTTPIKSFSKGLITGNATEIKQKFLDLNKSNVRDLIKYSEVKPQDVSSFAIKREDIPTFLKFLGFSGSGVNDQILDNALNNVESLEIKYDFNNWSKGGNNFLFKVVMEVDNTNNANNKLTDSLIKELDATVENTGHSNLYTFFVETSLSTTEYSNNLSKLVEVIRNQKAYVPKQKLSYQVVNLKSLNPEIQKRPEVTSIVANQELYSDISKYLNIQLDQLNEIYLDIDLSPESTNQLSLYFKTSDPMWTHSSNAYLINTNEYSLGLADGSMTSNWWTLKIKTVPLWEVQAETTNGNVALERWINFEREITSQKWTAQYLKANITQDSSARVWFASDDIINDYCQYMGMSSNMVESITFSPILDGSRIPESALKNNKKIYVTIHVTLRSGQTYEGIVPTNANKFDLTYNIDSLAKFAQKIAGSNVQIGSAINKYFLIPLLFPSFVDKMNVWSGMFNELFNTNLPTDTNLDTASISCQEMMFFWSFVLSMDTTEIIQEASGFGEKVLSIHFSLPATLFNFKDTSNVYLPWNGTQMTVHLDTQSGLGTWEVDITVSNCDGWVVSQ